MRRKKKPREGLVEVGALLEGALQTLGVKGDFEKFRVEKSAGKCWAKNFPKPLPGSS